jgi:hypothetical protein
MKAPELILRCYLKKRDSQWIAVCIDLCLAAQADTAGDARRRLEAQIVDYVEEALTIDKAFAAELLRRKAPLSQRIEYFLLFAAYRIHLVKSGIGQVFKTILPVHVGTRCHA